MPVYCWEGVVAMPAPKMGPNLPQGAGVGIPPQAPTYHSGGGDFTTSLNLPQGGGDPMGDWGELAH